MRMRAGRSGVATNCKRHIRYFLMTTARIHSGMKVVG